jgi:L-2-hydroxyglutarate oxidase
MTDRADVTVVGGGIVGLATARALLLARPGLRIRILERAARVAEGQSGHNSGVLHSGAYYRPGTAKARLCLRGRSLLLDYLSTKGLEYQIPGKLIVATASRELAQLELLGERAAANGVKGVRWRTSEEIRAREPLARGCAALEVPTAAIVDYASVTRSFVNDVEELGGEVRTNAGVTGVGRGHDDSLEIQTSGGSETTRWLVACAGIESDRVALRAGCNPGLRIVPFRGEYYRLKSPERFPITRLLYPVPDPRLPFLGVHLTRRLDGGIDAGPNAVLALGRDSYHRHDVRLRDCAELLLYPGGWSLARRWAKIGLYEELRSLSRSIYARDLQRMVPSITDDDLTPGGAGIRAQAVDRSGRLVDDFVLAEGPRSVHVVNAPSPAATSSMALAEEIRDRLLRRAGGDL